MKEIKPVVSLTAPWGHEDLPRVCSAIKHLFFSVIVDVILNDYGHITVAYMDKNGKVQNDMIHPTPLGEMQKAIGIKNEDIYLEDSHGCIHVTPDDIDEMIKCGFLKKGTKFIVHDYKDRIPKEWKRDSGAKQPYEVHFFPKIGFIVVVGEN